MAVTLFGEHIGFRDILSNFASLLAIVLVILGASDTQSSTTASTSMAFVALISQPFLLAIGDALMKQMKKLPEETVSFA